jgi:hypothetical protein
MHVETVQMDPRIATVHYRDYRHKVREHREERRRKLAEAAKAAGKELGRVRIEKTQMEKEDEALMKAYHALSKEKRLLNVPSAIRDAGVDDQYLPVLALAPAHWERAYFNVRNNESYFSKDRWATYNFKPARDFVRLPGIFPAETTNEEWRKGQKLQRYPVSALVPAIPPHLRPAGDLSEYCILWEAKWEPVAPADPILLKQLTDNLYVVLAQWDLTPIEQSVLEGRLRA